MRLQRIVILGVACLGCAVSVAGVAQAPANGVEAKPVQRYDVISVKPNKSGSDSVSVNTTDDSLYATNVSMKMLLSGVYHVRQGLIEGLPKWAEDSRWDVHAKISDPDKEVLKKMSREERRAMGRQLLADAFQVKVHPETRTMGVFDLVIAPVGLKMKENTLDKTDPELAKKNNGSISFSSDGKIEARGVTVDNLARNLEEMVEKTIVNKTGLPVESKWDASLHWTPEGRQTTDGDGVGIFSAIEEQLGMKLVPDKGPVQVLVVDNMQQPVED